ncbi:MAG: glycosyltransferase family 2 protein [Cyanobacteriota bacterium]|jgi:hypothetical protein
MLSQLSVKQSVRRVLRSDGVYSALCLLSGLVPRTHIPGSRSWLESLSEKPKSPTGAYAFLHQEPTLELSIIVPVYNMGAYVGACLDSIISQEVDADLEVIVVNDGSTDNSLDVIKAAMAKDQRIVLIDQANKGYSGARNVAIDRVRGRKICFVDSDDMIAPGHLATLLSKFHSHSCDFVTSRFTYVDENGDFVRPSATPRNHGAPWGRIYDRSVWADIRFPEGYWFEDTLQLYCIDSRYTELQVPEETGYLYRINAMGQSGQSPFAYKSLDSYWILEDMLALCRQLGIVINPKLYDITLMQMGPLLRGRTSVLSKNERMALFSACCDLIADTPEFQSLQTSLPGRWRDLEQALRTRNFYLWILACRELG